MLKVNLAYYGRFSGSNSCYYLDQFLFILPLCTHDPIPSEKLLLLLRSFEENPLFSVGLHRITNWTPSYSTFFNPLKPYPVFPYYSTHSHHAVLGTFPSLINHFDHSIQATKVGWVQKVIWKIYRYKVMMMSTVLWRGNGGFGIHSRYYEAN